MSKSLGNYVGVTDPPEDMFGKVMSIPDDVMDAYYTLVLGAEPPDGVEPVEAKRGLARQIVARFWDDAAATQAEEAFNRVHVDHQPPAEVEEADFAADGPVHLPAVMADAFGISRSEGRRLIEQGGVKLDGEVIGGGQLDFEPGTLDGTLLQVGKRRHRRLRARGTSRP
jgi:tyrosyl-tRNA synthetase